MADDVRTEHRQLTAEEVAAMGAVKAQGQALIDILGQLQARTPAGGREFALAKTKAEEAVMWAVKGITG